MKTITFEGVMTAGPCWSEAQVLDASGGEKEITLQELFDLVEEDDDFMANDILWVCFQHNLVYSKKDITK